MVTCLAMMSLNMEILKSGDDLPGQVPGYVKVTGKYGWKPATKVCPCIVSVLSHTVCHVVCSIHWCVPVSSTPFSSTPVSSTPAIVCQYSYVSHCQTLSYDPCFLWSLFEQDRKI